MAKEREKLLLLLKKEEVVYREPVKLRSGLKSDFYCDIKKSYGNPEILKLLAKAIAKKLGKENCVAVSGYGGLPLGAAVSIESGKKLIAVRESPKNHGRKNFIDGYVPGKKDSVVILDDVLTTGSSIKKTVQGLKSTGAKTSKAIVVVNRGNPKLSIPYDFIFNIEELIS